MGSQYRYLIIAFIPHWAGAIDLLKTGDMKRIDVCEVRIIEIIAIVGQNI